MHSPSTRTRSAPRRTRQTVAQERFLRRRQKLAVIVASALDPGHPLRHRLGPWERIPGANRDALSGPMEQIVILLRDPAVTISERTLRRVLAFVTDGSSPAYGEYPNQAGFAAHALAQEIASRARSGDVKVRGKPVLERVSV
jgi:hypothetical protein